MPEMPNPKALTAHHLYEVLASMAKTASFEKVTE